MSPKQTAKHDLVLSIPCKRDGEHPFVLDSPQERESFRIVVRCMESKRETTVKHSSGFSHFAANVWTLLSKFVL